MADNQFSVDVPNPLQALLIGQRSYDAANEAQQQRNLMQTRSLAAQDISGGDYKSGISRLLGIGDVQGATAVANMDNNAWSRQHTASQDARQAANDAFSQNLQTKQFGLSERAANRADEDKYAIKEVIDPNTNATTLVRVNTRGPEGPINTGVATSTPNNPFSQGGKFNGDQGKAAGFTDRMLQSESILSGVAPPPGQEGPPLPGVQGQGANFNQTALSNARETPIIGKVANYSISEDRQKYNQAKADFINAQLRRESGAAISESEFINADKQYFPVPGDGPAVIKQKAANRRAAIQAMGREGGPSYKPKSTFDEGGSIIPFGEPVVGRQRGQAGSTTPAPSNRYYWTKATDAGGNIKYYDPDKKEWVD